MSAQLYICIGTCAKHIPAVVVSSSFRTESMFNGGDIDLERYYLTQHFY